MGNEEKPIIEQKFENVEGELKHLREQVSLKKESFGGRVGKEEQKQITSQVINEYTQRKPEDVLNESKILDNPRFENIVSSVDALPHREKIRELYKVMLEHGVLNAIKIASGLNNPHVEEDFHHVLVHYIHTGSFIPGLDKEKELKKELSRTLYEVLVPLSKEHGEVEPERVLQSMQRFLAGIFGPGSESDPIYTFEIAFANFSASITFYISVPDTQKDLFVKQFLGNFPMARLNEIEKDYNIFNEFGYSIVGVGHHEKRFAYVLALPQGQMETLSPLLAAFQKIAKEGESAVVQYVVRKDDRDLLKKTRAAMAKLRDGESMSIATDIPLTLGGDAVKFIGGLFRSEKDKPKDIPPEVMEKRNRSIKLIEEKVAAPFLRVELRIVVSAGDLDRATLILQSIQSTFGQYANRESDGGIRFDTYTKGNLLKNEIHEYTYRQISEDAMVLNYNEFSALFHPPLAITTKEAPQLLAITSTAAPPPTELPEEGTLVGESIYRGDHLPIRMTKADRLRHLYVIGQTGTGKTTIMKNMIIEDIKAGEGCCFIDPHGSDVQDILANIPKERIDDVIYFDPSYMPRPVGLNMLEYDASKPEQKIFVVNELLAIFKKLYSSSPESMGPAFEQYFRNATMLVMEDPDTGNTMIDIMRVMADSRFRELKLSRCKNPIVVQFWKDIAGKTTGEAGLQNMIPYIVNKFDVFIANDIMRPIIAQEKSSFNFRDIMDNKKILLVNLAKGKLGEMNANLIGMILVGKIFLAAMSRVDSYGVKLPDFYLYIDEFQNISTPSIAGILSEARKYGLSLNIAHQYIAQLDDDIKDAVFGNVGSMAVFRISSENAQYLEPQFAPTFSADDLMKIESYNAYFKPLINGKPVTPFNIHIFPPSKGIPKIVDQLQQLSYIKYGRDRNTVDEVILKKYRETSAAKNASSTAAKPQSAPVQTPAPVQTQPQAPKPMSEVFAPQGMAQAMQSMRVAQPNNSAGQSSVTTPSMGIQSQPQVPAPSVPVYQQPAMQNVPPMYGNMYPPQGVPQANMQGYPPQMQMPYGYPVYQMPGQMYGQPVFGNQPGMNVPVQNNQPQVVSNMEGQSQPNVPQMQYPQYGYMQPPMYPQGMMPPQMPMYGVPNQGASIPQANQNMPQQNPNIQPNMQNNQSGQNQG